MFIWGKKERTAKTNVVTGVVKAIMNENRNDMCAAGSILEGILKLFLLY